MIHVMNRYALSVLPVIFLLMRTVPASGTHVADTVAVTVPVDSIVMVQDSLLPRMSYGSMLDSLCGSVFMSDSLEKAMTKQVEKNKARKAQGYRVRIYFDNSQNARMVSEQIADTFAVHYPDVPVYRIYDNPYFKVTVGEFRSKSDAMRFLEAIRPEYPTVFLVKETL